jgi:hypothetical protein
MKLAIGYLWAALAALAFAGTANAATATAVISYTPPTQYSDGAALPPAEIIGYAIECLFWPNPITSGAGTACQPSPPQLPGGTATTGTITFPYAPQGGRVCFRIAAAVAWGTGPWNATPACKTLASVLPGAPGNVVITVTIQTTP